MTSYVWQKEWYQNLDMCTPICGDISQNVSVNSLLCQPVLACARGIEDEINKGW